MKRIILSFQFCLLIAVFKAETVNQDIALDVAKNFLNYSTPIQVYKSPQTLELKETIYSQGELLGKPLMYIYTMASNGFIIISAEDATYPILAYSFESRYDHRNLAIGFRQWLDLKRNEILMIQAHKLKASEEIQSQWVQYQMDRRPLRTRAGQAVQPLIKAKWDQAPNYNAMCPMDNQAGERTVVGCVATAYAMVMHYWTYPPKGQGFHSYNHSKYGNLSSNFGSHTYDWTAMPTSISGRNDQIAQLCYDAGIAVEMEYGPSRTGGSSALMMIEPGVTRCTEHALKTHFGYKSTLRSEVKSNHSESNWAALLRAELDAMRPVLYAGIGNGGGHAFVCDGYDDNGLFHFNWGWAGINDGYFRLNSLNPQELGTGGGSGNFNDQQHALVGVESPQGITIPQTKLALYSAIVPSSSNFNFASPIRITTNIENKGGAAFSGDLGMALFDESENFVDLLQVINVPNLNSGDRFANDLEFANSGSVKLLPGKYFASLFYRTIGGQWQQVEGNAAQTNLTIFHIVNPSDIEQFSKISIGPDTMITQDRSSIFGLKMKNFSSSNFVGKYYLGLYDLDGNLEQVLDSVNESGLAGGSESSNLNFNTPRITVNPGSYLLASLWIENGGSQAFLAGSSFFQNPKKVIVQAAPLQQDIYEVNNSVAQARELVLNISGNNASFSTTNANLHNGADIDIYRVDFPAGNQYTISPRLQDLRYRTSSVPYTVDAILTLSENGNNWSQTIDDTTSAVGTLPNGGSLYVKIAPKFVGNVGTYQLDLNVTKSAQSSLTMVNDNYGLHIFPNPALDIVTVNFHHELKPKEIHVFDCLGRIQYHEVVPTTSKDHKINISGWAQGNYIIQVTHNNGNTITQKLLK